MRIINHTIIITAFFVSMLVQNGFAQTYFTRVVNTGALNQATAGISSSWGDINNDTYPDLVILQVGFVQLFTNNGDGTFTKINSGHLTNTQFYQNSVMFGDYDNDGNLDLYISNLGPNTPIPPNTPLFPQINFLYKNTGSPNYSFELITDNGLNSDSNMTWTSSWVDFDNDGNLDLLVPGDQGDKDLFFVNNGDGTFTENEDLLFLNPGEFSAAGGWTDFDNDGDQDLLIVNYQGANNELYRNDLVENGEIGFTKITGEPIVTDHDYDLAPSFGDYDNDGDMDVFIGTWIGNRNLLFRNNGGFDFTKISGEPIVEQTWTLAYTWLDFDNDGYLDCFVANSQGEKNTLYKNNGDGTFTKITEADAGDILSSWGFTSGASIADYDNDGDIDIFVPGGQASLFRNDVGSQNNWLQVTCEGVESNRQGIGTKIRVKAEISSSTGVWQLREIHGGPTGDRAQNHQRAHFGLGSAAKIDTLLIEWPSGKIDEYFDLGINQIFNAVEGDSPTSVRDDKSLELGFQLFQNYPNPFNPSTEISFSISIRSNVELVIYNSIGQKVRTLLSSQYLSAGLHSSIWNGKDDAGSQVSSGTYIYSLRAGDFEQSCKLILLK